MRVYQLIASFVGVVFAATVLVISLWRHADERAYELVASEYVQDVLDAEVIGEESEVILRQSDVALPGEWDYYPKVLMEKIRLAMSWNFGNKFRSLLKIGSERIEMAHELILINQPRLAVKTANKGVHYLEQATVMLRQEEMLEENKAPLWALVYDEAVYQEQSLNLMKYGISDLARPTITELCEQLIILQGEAKSKMTVETF